MLMLSFASFFLRFSHLILRSRSIESRSSLVIEMCTQTYVNCFVVCTHFFHRALLLQQKGRALICSHRSHTNAIFIRKYKSLKSNKIRSLFSLLFWYSAVFSLSIALSDSLTLLILSFLWYSAIFSLSPGFVCALHFASFVCEPKTFAIDDLCGKKSLSLSPS